MPLFWGGGVFIFVFLFCFFCNAQFCSGCKSVRYDKSWDWEAVGPHVVSIDKAQPHNVIVLLSTVMPMYDWVWQLEATGASCKDAVVLLQRISVYIHRKLENVGHGSWLVLAMWLFCYQGAFFTLTKCGHKLKLTMFRFLQDSMPDLHSHFQYNDIQTHMYASQWFLTLFTAKFPLPMVYRIMDLFLCYVSHDSVNSLQ